MATRGAYTCSSHLLPTHETKILPMHAPLPMQIPIRWIPTNFKYSRIFAGIRIFKNK